RRLRRSSHAVQPTRPDPPPRLPSPTRLRPYSTPLPYTTLFRSYSSTHIRELLKAGKPREAAALLGRFWEIDGRVATGDRRGRTRSESTRLNSSHRTISYAVFCLKKKKTYGNQPHAVSTDSGALR